MCYIKSFLSLTWIFFNGRKMRCYRNILLNEIISKLNLSQKLSFIILNTQSIMSGLYTAWNSTGRSQIGSRQQFRLFPIVVNLWFMRYFSCSWLLCANSNRIAQLRALSIYKFPVGKAGNSRKRIGVRAPCNYELASPRILSASFQSY